MAELAWPAMYLMMCLVGIGVCLAYIFWRW